PHVPADRQLLFEQTEVAGGKKLRFTSYVVHATAEVTGEDIYDAFVTRDTQSIGQMPLVSLRFTNTGARRFADLTGANIKKRLAIVLDNIIVSAPTLDEKISGGQAVIRLGQGGYQERFEEAQS